MRRVVIAKSGEETENEDHYEYKSVLRRKTPRTDFTQKMSPKPNTPLYLVECGFINDATSGTVVCEHINSVGDKFDAQLSGMYKFTQKCN